VASLSQGRTAAAQCGLFTHKSVPVIFEPPCIMICNLGSWFIVLRVWGLHRGVIEDFVFLVCDDESSGPIRIDAVLLGPFDPLNEGTVFVWSVRDHLHSGAASHHRRPGSLISLSVLLTVRFCLVTQGCVNCERSPIFLWFEVLSAVLLKFEALWVVVLCWVHSC